MSTDSPASGLAETSSASISQPVKRAVSTVEDCGEAESTRRRASASTPSGGFLASRTRGSRETPASGSGSRASRTRSRFDTSTSPSGSGCRSCCLGQKWVRAVNAGLEAEEEESAIVCVSDVMDEPAGVKRLETPLPPRESLNAHRVFDQERSPMGMDSAAVHPLPGSVGFSDPAGYKQKADQAGAQASSPSNMSPAAAINPDTQDLGSRGPVHDTQRSEDRERLAIIAVLALSLVFACTILSFFLPEAKLLGDLSGWCDTSECRSHASLLTDGLNRSVDPCRDIDAYVCSTWHPNPVFAPFLHMALDDLSIRWLEDLEKLLRDSVFHMPVAEKPLAMYRACVDNSGADLVDRAVFRRFLRDRGLSWPGSPTNNASASSIIVDLALRWEMSLWLRIRVLEHPFVPGGRRFLLLPGRNSDARLFVAMHENVMKTGGYARYWHMIHYFVTSREPGHDVSDVIKRSAETQGISVAMLLQIMFMGSYVTPSIFRISNNGSDVGNRTGGYWVKSLSTHLFPLQPLSPSDDVLIANTELLEVLRKFIQGRGDKEALTHISWQVVQMYAVMLDKELLLNILENTQEAAALNAMLCAREVDAVYNPVLTVLYARSRLTSTSKTQVNALYRTLMQRAVDAVKRLPWLDADGQQFFARRLQSTVVRLWPPDVFEDAEKVEEIYVHCPLREGSFMRLWVAVRQCLGDLLVGKHRAYVSAVAPSFTPYLFTYDSFEPSADIALEALASPVYSTRGTPGMLFGGLGSMLAVILLHVFNGQKQLVHPNGSVQVSGSWLSEANTKALVQAHECLRPAVPSAIAGLEIARLLFVERLQNSFHRNLSSELTDEKVFFMTFCRMLCHTHRSLWGQVGCNYIVKHIAAFRAAFQCSDEVLPTPRQDCQFF